MLHPDTEDGVIVHEAGTLHGVKMTVLMSQIWIKGHNEFARKALDIDLEDCSYDCGSTRNQMKIDLEDPEDMFSQISIHEEYSGPIGQSTILLHDTKDSTLIRIHKNIRLLYESLAKTTIAYHEL